MRALVIGKHASDLNPILKKHGIEKVRDDEDPDVVITYGGDGSLIGAEQDYPEVPKLAIRDRRSCKKCEEHRDDAVIARLAAGEAPPSKLPKLSARVNGHRFLGMNDILLRNRDIRSAVRFAVWVNDERITDEIIGDGLVVSTPFGSSAYFRSITTTTFRTGIGLAFNNCTEFVNHLVLRERDRVRVEIIRGPAELTSDNNPDIAAIESGDDIVIGRSQKAATVMMVSTLRCSHCRYTHAPRRRF